MSSLSSGVIDSLLKSEKKEKNNYTMTDSFTDSISTLELRSYLLSSFLGALVFPIYQIFLPLLSIALGADTFEVGLIGGGGFAVYCFMPFVMGRFTNRNRTRRFFIVFSSVSLIAISYSYAVVASPLVLIATRIVEGLVWALFIPALESAIATRRSPEAHSLGMLNVAFSAAAAAGPIIGAYVADSFSTRSVFLATTVILILALVTNMLPLVRRRGSSIPTTTVVEISSSRSFFEQKSEEEKSKVYPIEMRQKVNTFFAIPAALCASTSTVVLTFFPPYATSAGIPILLIGAAAFATGAMRLLTNIVLTRVKIRRKLLNATTRNRNLLLSFSFVSLPCLFFFVPDSTGILYIIPFALIGIGYSVCQTISQAALIGEAPHDKIGVATGIFESSIGSGGFLAPVLAGIIASKSLVASFYLPLSLFFVLVLLVAIRRAGENHR